MCAPSAEAVISGRVTYVKMSCLQATKIHLAPLPLRHRTVQSTGGDHLRNLMVQDGKSIPMGLQ